MAEVEVGLGAVIRHIDFAMLIGRHRAGIDIQIGIELANAHTISTRLQQCCKGGGHKAFAKRGDHAAGDENIPRHGSGGLTLFNRVGQAHDEARLQLIFLTRQ
jgi:hypothetical protein